MWLAWWLRGRVSAEACGPGAQEKQSRTGLPERAQCAGLAEYASEKERRSRRCRMPYLINHSQQAIHSRSRTR